MAPITEEVVHGLKDMIEKLETRVQELEGRLVGDSKPKSVAEQMRIVLMGPPGAGMDFPGFSTRVADCGNGVMVLIGL
jgi:adenylate kinase